VLGRTVNVDGRAAQIVGVLPPDFEMPNLAKVDLLLPQQLNIAPGGAGHFLYAFARLKSGITIQQARAALLPIFEKTLEEVPPPYRKEVSFSISPLHDRQIRDHRTAAAVLFSCVLGLMLIACANVASLLLARAAGRQRELAVRSAIGAGRGRLARQAILESLLLGVAGGLAGLALGSVLLRAFGAMAPEGIPRLAGASLDFRVLGFALLLSIVCALIFGLAPALQSPRLEALNSAKTVGRGLRTRQVLVALQVGLSVALLTGAGLLIRSLQNMARVPLGLHPEHVLTAQIRLSESYADERQRSGFFERVLESARTLPGLRKVALADAVPLATHPLQIIYSNMIVEGRPPATANIGTGGMVVDRTVTPEYFAAMGIPILRGRSFTEADRGSQEQALILGESLAKRMFPGEDPIGIRMRPFADVPFWRRIVGIAADVKNGDLTGKDDPEFYRVWRSGSDGNRQRAYLIVRTEANPAMVSDLLRSRIGQLDPALPMTVTSMEEIVGRQFVRPRFETSLLALFAGIGLLLAAVGQFGVMGTLVTNRSGRDRNPDGPGRNGARRDLADRGACGGVDAHRSDRRVRRGLVGSAIPRLAVIRGAAGGSGSSSNRAGDAPVGVGNRGRGADASRGASGSRPFASPRIAVGRCCMLSSGEAYCGGPVPVVRGSSGQGAGERRLPDPGPRQTIAYRNNGASRREDRARDIRTGRIPRRAGFLVLRI
jgi:predicted permease